MQKVEGSSPFSRFPANRRPRRALCESRHFASEGEPVVRRGAQNQGPAATRRQPSCRGGSLKIITHAATGATVLALAATPAFAQGQSGSHPAKGDNPGTAHRLAAPGQY